MKLRSCWSHQCLLVAHHVLAGWLTVIGVFMKKKKKKLFFQRCVLKDLQVVAALHDTAALSCHTPLHPQDQTELLQLKGNYSIKQN